MEQIEHFLQKAVLRKNRTCTFEEVHRGGIEYIASLEENTVTFPLHGTRCLSFAGEHGRSRERTLMKVVRLLEHSYVEDHRIIVSGLRTKKDAHCLAAGLLLLMKEAESIAEAAERLKHLDPTLDPAPLCSETWLNHLLV